ncbi:MAG: tyrosine--tRNA ligase [Firmicutes bacterium]|nr:tyrosine--tRNA ligase [Bacillota bacterium]
MKKTSVKVDSKKNDVQGRHTVDTKIFEVLQSRGYVYQCTDSEGLQKRLASGERLTFYLGIDPTADSLHIGHFFALMMFRHLQRAGHKGILVIGGATAMVGDPSGKSDLRKVLTADMVAKNIAEVGEIAKKFVDTVGDNAAVIVDNSEWLAKYSYIDFMREIGVHFNVAKMLAADAYAKRLAGGGLTFLEMGYMPMQAFDFAHLHKAYGCVLQIGGSDQWGNIVAGTNLARKRGLAEGVETKQQEDLFGLTSPLLLNKDGNKMGKTEKGALWVARDKTSVYDFYQYFYNIDDADVGMLLRLFTDVPLSEIETVCKQDILKAKKLMAYEITKLVHGVEDADKVLQAVAGLFGGGDGGENAPLSAFAVKGGKIGVVDLFFESGLVASKGEVRRLIEQNGLVVDGQKVASIQMMVTRPKDKNFVLLKKGKKNYMKVEFVD